MSAADLLADLARRGVRLKAEGERLRYFPRSALTPELLTAMQALKPELLAVVELFEERAAIMEFDGGLSRPDAERLAMADIRADGEGGVKPTRSACGLNVYIRHAD